MLSLSPGAFSLTKNLTNTPSCYGPFNLGITQLVGNAILVILYFLPKIVFYLLYFKLMQMGIYNNYRD